METISLIKRSFIRTYSTRAKASVQSVVTKRHLKKLHLSDQPLPSTIMAPQNTGYLTEFEKGQIVALRKKEISFSEIGELLHRPKRTVQTFHNRFQKRGDANTLPKPGRPKIITTRTCRRLVRESKKARHQSLSELRNDHDGAPHASLVSVKRALASVNIKKWRARKRALLKYEHAVKRLAWAMEYKNWTKEDFEVVIFSDECMVEKSKDPNGIWVFRTPEEKWYKDCIHRVTKGAGIK